MKNFKSRLFAFTLFVTLAYNLPDLIVGICKTSVKYRPRIHADSPGFSVNIWDLFDEN